MSTGSGPSRGLITSPVSVSSSKAPPPPYAPNSQPSSVKKRTSHACDRCRIMRTKCSGGTRCSRCQKDDAVCLYGDHKRERNKKDLVESISRIKELQADNHNLVSALRRLITKSDAHVEDPGVLQLLSKYSDDEEQASSSRDSRSQSQSAVGSRQDSQAKSEVGGEGNVTSSIGSPHRQGELDRLINLDHGAGAAGYIGKMAAMSWLTRCHEHLQPQPGPGSDEFMSDATMRLDTTTDLNFYLDDQDLLSVDEDLVDPLQWPQFDFAVIYTEAYFYATRGAVPLLLREQFLNTLYSFPRHAPSTSWSHRRWLSQANLVWAIGSKWLQKSGLALLERPDIHLEYYARSRALGLDHRMMLDSPDVDVLQGIGLLAFYLLTNGSVTRAWNAVGDAVRQAMSLGLHLRVANPDVDLSEQNRRARIWFSFYKLHASIVEITGRPGLIRTSYVTLSIEKLELPVGNIDMDSSIDPSLTHSSMARGTWLSFLQLQNSYGQAIAKDVNVSLSGTGRPHEGFLYDVRLCQLSEEIADSLYVDQQRIPWSHTQKKIDELQQSLDAWAGTLPSGLTLTGPLETQSNPQASVQLAMYNYSLTMTLHRPCLCVIQIRKESQQSKAFNLRSARSCIQAALSLIELLPTMPSTSNVFQLLPWWMLLHYLCQAGSVVLLELCLDVQHFQGGRMELVGAMWKVMSFLSCLAEDSISAYKAWRIFQHLLQGISARYGDGSLFQFELVPRAPTRWTETEERVLHGSLQ